MREVAQLQDHLLRLGRVILGYSGGVDSALLAVVATRALGPERFLAVIGKSASYPEAQWRRALATARQFGIPARELDTEELSDARYLTNPVNRCYFCKSELWSKLDALARAEGFDAVVDGTNVDDLGEHRPGMAAASERGVGSPLADLGWTKEDVRGAARDLGIPVWDAPASPCLSSRIRYGLAITPERLGQVETAEVFLRELGVLGDLRVRHLGRRASIEVVPGEMPLVDGAWARVEVAFARIGFEEVVLDRRGYRRGGLLVLTGATG